MQSHFLCALIFTLKISFSFRRIKPQLRPSTRSFCRTIWFADTQKKELALFEMLCATTPNNFNIQRFSIAVADLDQHFSRVNQLSMMKQHELFPCSRNFPFELNKMTPNSTLCRKRAHTHTHQWAWQWFSKARNFLIFNESQIKFKLNTLGQFPQIENAMQCWLAQRAHLSTRLCSIKALFSNRYSHSKVLITNVALSIVSLVHHVLCQ